MNKYQVKWSKELVGKKVYACSASNYLSHSGVCFLSRDSCNPWLCQAMVVSITGKRAVVKPLNFIVWGERDSDHVVTSREAWYTSPRAAVLARLREFYECIVKSIRENHVDRIFGEFSPKLDGRRDPLGVLEEHSHMAYEYYRVLEFVQLMERFKCYPCDYFYQHMIYCLDWDFSFNGRGALVEDGDPLAERFINNADFRKGIRNIKCGFCEDVTACFEKMEDGKYKFKLLPMYQFLKSQGCRRFPIIHKELLRSVPMKRGGGFDEARRDVAYEQALTNFNEADGSRHSWHNLMMQSKEIEIAYNKKRYSCFLSLNPMTKAVGAIEGSKEEVLAWMREKNPGLSAERPVGKGFLEVNVLFYGGDAREFWTPDGKGIYLAEILTNER